MFREALARVRDREELPENGPQLPAGGFLMGDAKRDFVEGTIVLQGFFGPKMAGWLNQKLCVLRVPAERACLSMIMP